MQLPFNFRESNAIFIDLLLFTVITTGDTKQSSSTSFFLDVRILSASSIRVPHLLVDVGVPIWIFVLLGSVPVSSGCLSRLVLSFCCFQINPEIC